jgi:hypothetical protein
MRMLLALLLVLAPLTLAAEPAAACHPSFMAGDPDVVAVSQNMGCDHHVVNSTCAWLLGLRLCV